MGVRSRGRNPTGYIGGPVSHNAWSYQRRRCNEGPDGRPCEVCRADQRRFVKEQHERRVARMAADPNFRPHGDHNTYANYGCRCQPCSDAYSQHMQKRYKREGPRQRGTGRYSGIPLMARESGRRKKAKPFGREWLDDAE